MSVMVGGAGCWTDETEKPGFSTAQLFVAYTLAWCEKFLAVLHISSAQWRGADPLEQLTTRVGGRMDKMLSVDSPAPDLHVRDQ